MYHPTPIQEIENELTYKAHVKVLVKREDLNHPLVSGNKWWKLKYNLEEAKNQQASTLLTFGGAYSNHIYATAAASRMYGFKSIGIIRGEPSSSGNPTLSFARQQGMKLEFTSREDYRLKSQPPFLDGLKKKWGDFYMIPEGGTNTLAVKGCEEFAAALVQESKFDMVALPVGTGGTMAGLINALPTHYTLGFSALKGGSFLNREVTNYVTDKSNGRWRIFEEYHFGGYAKLPDGLISFMKNFESSFGIPLDPVYTAKTMFGIFDLIEKSWFDRGSTLMIIHTGGLQGRAGFNFGSQNETGL